MLRRQCLLQGALALSQPWPVRGTRARRQVVGIDLGREPVPDEPTLGQFRQLLEGPQLGAQLLARIGGARATHGLKISQETIVEATILRASPSTKRRLNEREREMQETTTGDPWYCGMTGVRSAMVWPICTGRGDGV